MLAWAMRRIISLMNAALTPFVPLRGPSSTTAIAKRQAPAVELDEFRAADAVRKAAPRSPGRYDRDGPAKSALELLRPVGGEDEQDIRVLLSSPSISLRRPLSIDSSHGSHVVAIARE